MMIILKLCRILAWTCLFTVIVVTVCPIDWRPETVTEVDFDRAFAFAGMSFLFIVGYPRQWLVFALLIMIGAGVFEILQYLSPSRHPHIEDALVKTTGAAVGILVGRIFNRTSLPGMKLNFPYFRAG